jgi:hypothetical protein
MKSSYGPAPSTRPLADTIPAVNRVRQAERIADRDDPFADFQMVAVAEIRTADRARRF